MKKAAFITGSSGGIGKEIALRLANDGFAVACCYHSDETGAKELENALTAMNAQCKMYKLNLSDTLQTQKVFKEASDFFGGFYVLVNCAGVALVKLFTDTNEEEFDFVNQINYKSVYTLSRLAIDDMVKKKAGKIINISSMWGVCGASCEVVYSTSKAAVIGLTKALAKELAPSNIQVNCVAPGAIDTKMNNNLTQEEKENFAKAIPMGRFGTPKEIAGVVSFLASEDSNYVTGQVIAADGGLI